MTAKFREIDWAAIFRFAKNPVLLWWIIGWAIAFTLQIMTFFYIYVAAGMLIMIFVEGDWFGLEE